MLAAIYYVTCYCLFTTLVDFAQNVNFFNSLTFTTYFELMSILHYL